MSPPSESLTDLVIIGAGPAGLMAACWAAKYNIPTRILDDKTGRVQTGHADGLTCRTMEILDSFGVADTIVRESSHNFQMKHWVSTPQHGVECAGTVNSQKPGISRFQQCTLHQGRIEQILQETIEASSEVRVERNVKTLELNIDEELASSEALDARPITIKVQHMISSQTSDGRATMPAAEQHETIRAKYLIGCDGAHSWTRRQLQIDLKGDTSNALWGVLDIVPLTNFPDIRHTCVIYSEDHGAIHLVPREGRLVRLYVQLVDASATQAYFDRSSVTPKMLLEIIKRIFLPYEIDYEICDWWSVYQIGQRIADDFSVHNRIFLAGDAVHTHSPKIGQGMNIAMADTFNLVWKICSVIKGSTRRCILSTYQEERRSVALAVLELDRDTLAYYSSFRDTRYDLLSGVAVQYAESVITCRSRHEGSAGRKDSGAMIPQADETAGAPRNTNPSLAKNVNLGRRMPSFLISNITDARPTWIADLLQSTGAWRILVFAGDVQIPDQMRRIQDLGAALTSACSVLPHHIGNTVEIYTILAGNRDAVSLLDLPPVFHPWDNRLGWDYGKVFADEKCVSGVGGGDAYESLGIGKEEGCIVVCRPDQHVGVICRITEWHLLDAYFAGFLIKNE